MSCCFLIISHKNINRFLDYVRKFATEDALNERSTSGAPGHSSTTNGSSGGGEHSADHNSDSESSMSDYSEDEARDMEL